MLPRTTRLSYIRLLASVLFSASAGSRYFGREATACGCCECEYGAACIAPRNRLPATGDSNDFLRNDRFTKCNFGGGVPVYFTLPRNCYGAPWTNDACYNVPKRCCRQVRQRFAIAHSMNGMSVRNGAIIACWMLLQSAAALLIPTVLPSAASVPRAAIYMHASGDEVDGALPQPPAEALPSEADAARDEAALFFSEHGDENAYFDDEDVPDDQAMADWRVVRKLNRMFAAQP